MVDDLDRRNIKSTLSITHNSSSSYGYNGLLDSLRDRDFSRFQDSVYVDYTGLSFVFVSFSGAGQYRDSQIKKVMEDIKNHPYGNTHSNSPASKNSEVKTDVVESDCCDN